MNKTKGKKQNKVAIVALAALLTVGIVAGSLAYFTTTSTFDNVFKVGAPSGSIVETFDNPTADQVARGGSFNKSAKAVNTGDVPLLARAKVTAKWTKADNTTPLANELTTGVPAATLVFGKTNADATADFSVNAFKTTDFANDIGSTTIADTSAAKWYYSTDGYFYYKDVVAPKTTTDKALLKSVDVSNTIADVTTTKTQYYPYVGGSTDVDADGYSTTAQATKPDVGTKYKAKTISTAKYTDFVGATLTVTITGDVIQADKAALAAAEGATDASKWVVTEAIKTTWGLK